MKYEAGENVSLGDRITFNSQPGFIALIGSEPASGSPSIKREEWKLNDREMLILFDNGARLKLDELHYYDELVFVSRKVEN